MTARTDVGADPVGFTFRPTAVNTGLGRQTGGGALSRCSRCNLFLRREAIRGYFRSQAGLIELDYKGNAVYGACPGCESRRG